MMTVIVLLFMTSQRTWKRIPFLKQNLIQIKGLLNTISSSSVDTITAMTVKAANSPKPTDTEIEGKITLVTTTKVELGNKTLRIRIQRLGVHETGEGYTHKGKFKTRCSEN